MGRLVFFFKFVLKGLSNTTGTRDSDAYIHTIEVSNQLTPSIQCAWDPSFFFLYNNSWRYKLELHTCIQICKSGCRGMTRTWFSFRVDEFVELKKPTSTTINIILVLQPSLEVSKQFERSGYYRRCSVSASAFFFYYLLFSRYLMFAPPSQMGESLFQI